MAIFLTQDEADYLFDLEKIPLDKVTLNFPETANKTSVMFTSLDKREKFIFDITRAYIKINKITYQKRARKSFVLRRLDINGSPHKNPEVEDVPLEILEPYNAKEIACPHLHIYVEGFHHKWAIPAEIFFSDLNNSFDNILKDFFKYCNVTNIPPIQNVLF
ncbi:MAG: hypothetical protein M3R36_09900 [Bacteroidota bacterium]|nr:hypothetical protein [Bacteroidota bacterium]